MPISTDPATLEMQRVRSILNVIQREQTEAHRRSRMANAVAFSVVTKLPHQLSR